MRRSTSSRIALAIMLSCSMVEVARVEADCSDPDDDRDPCGFHPYVAAPALVAESLVPGGETTRWGGGVQLVLYGWSDNNERPGPGQGRVFAQFSVLCPLTVATSSRSATSHSPGSGCS